MYAQQLGFTTSWKMLTRDKGWIKPILMLTLVGWIPILGQIAILGYGLEWARLTAWGVDAAPKQRGVAYGKVLATGGIAFLVMLTMGLVTGIVDTILFGRWYSITSLPFGSSIFADSVITLAGDVTSVLGIAVLVVNLLMGAFITAAMLRATLYDSFGAGWRIDRLFQMVARDPGGFFHAYAVSLIGGIVNSVYAMVVTLAGGLAAFGGAMGVALSMGIASDTIIERLLYGAGPGLVILLVVVALAAAFAGSAISITMQLVSINAMGQWFCRFRVDLWGVSSAPLPDGVPVRFPGTGAGAPARPQAAMPQQPGADPATAYGAPASAYGAAAAAGVAAAAAGAATAAGAGHGSAAAPGTAAPVAPVAGAAPVASPAAGADASAAPAPGAVVPPAAATEPAAGAAPEAAVAVDATEAAPVQTVDAPGGAGSAGDAPAGDVRAGGAPADEKPRVIAMPAVGGWDAASPETADEAPRSEDTELGCPDASDADAGCDAEGAEAASDGEEAVEASGDDPEGGKPETDR